MLLDRQPIVWADSEDYIAVSKAPFWSLAFWAGQRPVAVPFLLRLVGRDPTHFTYALALIAAVCWAALAAAVGAALPEGWRRVVGVAAVAGFSLTFPVVTWERSVLSESLALSFLALLLAALLWFCERLGTWQVAGILGAVALWLASRDTHVVVVFLTAVGLAGALVLAPRLPRQRQLAVLAVGTFALTLLSFTSASHGERHQFPLRNVYGVRILPYPDRVEWFADHGMPQAKLFVDPTATNARPPIRDPGKAPVTWVAADDPAIQPWLRWVERHGQRTLLLWMTTHPGYVLTEPWEDPERSFNNAEGDRDFYAPIDTRDVPLVTGLFMLPRTIAIAVAAAAVAWTVTLGRWRSRLFLVGLGALVLAAPHALVSWHSDGMETARHLLVPVIQFNLGVLLLVLAAVLQPWSSIWSAEPAAEGVDDAGGDVETGDVDPDPDGRLDPSG
jgi:hypothetical protein